MVFVDELQQLGAVGTFFEIGDQLSTYDPTGAAQRAMLADGDMIGDHTWTHPDMEVLAPAQQTSELELTADAIHHATGFTPCLWRPPYGTVDPALESLARNLGFLTVYWNDDTRDWSLPGTSAIVSTALSEARNGGIILMHFGGGPRSETIDALPAIVGALRARRYHFVNVAQLLGLREIWR
jgi:peptidoglycan/xylan/chitin deacetylase (PgdA/CDA1 family)